MSLLDVQGLEKSIDNEMLLIDICRKYIQKHLIESYINITNIKYHRFINTDIDYNMVTKYPDEYVLCINVSFGLLKIAIFEKTRFDNNQQVRDYGYSWGALEDVTLKDVIFDDLNEI